MSNNTGIEWTDATWNPIRGCSRVSEGCRNCYAERVAHRFSGKGQPYEGLTQLVNGHAAWTGKVSLVEKHLLDPLEDSEMKKPVFIDCEMCGGASVRDTCMHGSRLSPGRWRPRRIFVNSMSDLFHPNVPDEWIDRIFAVMALCPQHTFQVLTKRPERMLAYFRRLEEDCGDDHHWWNAALDMECFSEQQLDQIGDCAGILPNVHLGVSVEDQKTADERIPLLLQTPAAVRFISAEPLLGAIELKPSWVNPTRQNDNPLGWVICGGESGPGARPMHPDWARGLRDQCVAAGVPFFLKQMGSVYGPKKGHDIPADLDIKEFPNAAR